MPCEHYTSGLKPPHFSDQINSHDLISSLMHPGFTVYQRRDMHIPSTLLEYLVRHMPDFAQEERRTQVGICQMLYLSQDKRRQHKKYPGAIAFSADDLKEMFGSSRAFDEINRGPAHRYFYVHRSQNSKTKQHNYTRGFETRPWLASLFAFFLLTNQRCDLLTSEGHVRRTAPRAIKSIDKDGNVVRFWACDDAPNLVPINMLNLERFEERMRMECITSHAVIPSESPACRSDERVERLLAAASSIRHAASSAAFHGHVMHQYQQSSAGRLYAAMPSLQNCPKEVRNAALAGMWDYDIACCHFAILMQMAARFGCDCPNIGDYVANKREWRQGIADEVDITIDQTKTALTAMIYGARQSVRPEDAIPMELGAEAANRLYSSYAYVALKNEIIAATAAIKQHHPRIADMYVNLCDKGISVTAKPYEVLSHLLQGVEVMALRAAVRAAKGKVLLLQHDGFVASERLDTAMLEQAVLNATDEVYDLRFEEAQIDGFEPEFAPFSEGGKQKTMDDAKSMIINKFGRFSGPNEFTVVIHGGQHVPMPIPPAFPAPLDPAIWTPAF